MNDHYTTLTRQQLIEEVKRLKTHAAGLELALAEKTCDVESRHQYEFIVNTSRELLSLIDNNYSYVAINDAYCKAHGRRRQDIVGMSVVDIWGTEVFESTIRSKLARCFAGEEVQYQARFELPSMGVRSMEVTYYPYRNSDDQVTHVVVVSRDITEKNSVEQELVALKKAVETMQLGVTISSYDGKILFTNPAEAAMHGYSPAELIGKRSNVFASDPAMQVAAPVDISKISSWRRESVNIDRLGKSFPVHLMSDVVRSQDGKPIAIVTTCENITERKRIELKLKQQVERITVLRELDMMILSNLEIRELLKVLLSYLIDKLAIDSAAILLRNHTSLMLECVAECGFRTPSYRHVQLKLGEGLAGTVAYEQLSRHVPDIHSLDGASVEPCLVSDEGFRFYYGVPLIAKGTVIGTLEVFHRSHFEPDDDWIYFLNALAGQAAVAVDYTSMFRDLQHSRDELMLAYDTTIEGWSRALDYRDKETEGHSRRVTELTVKVAQYMGIGDSDIVHVRRGALLHDIGKLGVPDGILFKPGRLTNEEWQIMKKHPEIAFELLTPIAFLRPSVNIPYCHHEKWDGSGYPKGLCGEQIPLEARIFSLVDVWDALSNDRYYRTAWPMEKVHAHIRELSGTHFDPKVVQAFFQGMDQIDPQSHYVCGSTKQEKARGKPE
jgi:PAS domain S-box-containing protein